MYILFYDLFSIVINYVKIIMVIRVKENKIQVEEFRDGIFSLNTRRFGKVAELMIKELYGLGNAQSDASGAYDLFSDDEQKKIEVKFSTVLRKCKENINSENVIGQIMESNLETRMLEYGEIASVDFDCNIQQIKRKEFDVLYYGCFFGDKIMICKMDSDEILDCYGYSDKQHRGNEGEGQFHIKNDTIDFHLNKYLITWLSYEELFALFNK